MDTPTPLASGRDADVYPLDDDRVLRRYRDGGDVTAEATVMAYLAGHGFPVPRVYAARGADLILERLAGPTLAQAAVRGVVTVPATAAVLAGLHSRLHALPARSGVHTDDRILHLDLHPENVIMTPGGPVLIDWRNTAEGPPDLDLAISALILAEVAVGPASEYSGPANAGLAEFVAAAGGDPLSGLDRAVRMRRANPTLTSAEVGRLDRAAALVRAVAGARRPQPGGPTGRGHA